MNDNIKEDTVLKSSSKYSQMPIEYRPPKYTSSDILTIIFTLILFAIFLGIIFYMVFGNKNKGFEPINLHPNEKNVSKTTQQNTNLCDVGPNEKCLSCSQKECGSCNPGYKLQNGKCIPNFTLKAVYQTSNKNEFIALMNEFYVPYISEIIIDNAKIQNPSCKHLFPEEGEHIILMNFKKEEIISMKMMFNSISNLISIIFTSEFSDLKIINMKGIFSDCKNLKTVEFQSTMPSTIKDFSFMFDNCKSITEINLSNLNTKNAIDISYMFAKCSSLKTININSLDTINVKDMSGLFYECTSLTSIDLNKFNTKNVQSLFYMFAGCTSLNNIIINFPENNIKDISYMFKDCSKLTNIDLSQLNSKNLSNINNLFMGCSSLTNVKFDNKFDVNNIIYAEKIFEGCNKLNKNIINSMSKLNNDKNLSKRDSTSSNKEKENKIQNKKIKKGKKMII